MQTVAKCSALIISHPFYGMSNLCVFCSQPGELHVHADECTITAALSLHLKCHVELILIYSLSESGNNFRILLRNI